MNAPALPKLSPKKWACLALLGFGLDLWWLQHSPSEATMRQTFFEHRREFDELRVLSQRQQSQVDSHGDLSAPKDAAEVARRTRLSALTKSLGVSEPMYFRGLPPHISFSVFGGGFTDTTWGIGYAWSSVPLSPIVASAYAMPRNKQHQHYVRLDGGWCIYHRR